MSNLQYCKFFGEISRHEIRVPNLLNLLILIAGEVCGGVREVSQKVMKCDGDVIIALGDNTLCLIRWNVNILSKYNHLYIV